MCDRAWRAGVGRRGDSPAEPQLSRPWMFFGQVFNFPFPLLDWPMTEPSCDVGSSRVAFHHHREGGDGCGSQHCRASSTGERGRVRVTFFQHRSNLVHPRGHHLIPLGQLDLCKAYRPAPILARMRGRVTPASVGRGMELVPTSVELHILKTLYSLLL